MRHLRADWTLRDFNMDLCQDFGQYSPLFRAIIFSSARFLRIAWSPLCKETNQSSIPFFTQRFFALPRAVFLGPFYSSSPSLLDLNSLLMNVGVYHYKI